MYQITFISKEEKDPGIRIALEELGNKFLGEKNLGRRKFSYPIKKERAGFYKIYFFQCNPKKLKELNQKLKLNEQLLRYLIIEKESKKEKIISITKEKTLETFKEKPPVFVKEKKVLPESLEETKVKTEKETKEVKEKSKIHIEDKKKPTPEIKEKSLEKAEETKTIKMPEKKIFSRETETGEEERLKKLEEKLDELLKE